MPRRRTHRLKRKNLGSPRQIRGARTSNAPEKKRPWRSIMEKVFKALEAIEGGSDLIAAIPTEIGRQQRRGLRGTLRIAAIRRAVETAVCDGGQGKTRRRETRG